MTLLKIIFIVVFASIIWHFWTLHNLRHFRRTCKPGDKCTFIVGDRKYKGKIVHRDGNTITIIYLWRRVDRDVMEVAP